MENNYPALTISFENQQTLIKQILKDYVLTENEVYQMMIEKKEKQTRMSKNSVEISFTAYLMSAKYCKVLLCSLQVFSYKLITKLASTTKTKLLL